MVDDTETLVDAMRRVVLDETGLIMTGWSLFGTFTDPSGIVSYPDGNVYRTPPYLG
jgi:ADP-ribose pyrophosphatase YjhB (NUDIX family)